MRIATASGREEGHSVLPDLQRTTTAKWSQLKPSIQFCNNGYSADHTGLEADLSQEVRPPQELNMDY